MAKVKTTCEVKTYDEQSDWKHGEPLKVRSYWNRKDFVEIEVAGKKILVVGSELQKAMSNCMNT